MKKILIPIIGLICSVALCSPTISVHALSQEITNASSKAMILMDINGDILYENNADEKLPIASITKLMTILITLENIENGNLSTEDNIRVSERASSMGGSQIFLDANSDYNLKELLKSVIVCSANDSAVALAETISGSENLFVEEMNKRANELNMTNTNYVNCTGLPAPNGYSSAKDTALLLKEVEKYPLYTELCSIWLEDFKHPSGRTTTMTNTNKLIKHYDGCLGGKTGSTTEAGYCLATCAERNNLKLIAVSLGSSNSKDRFKSTSDLLNYGFANYKAENLLENKLPSINIKGQNRSLSVKFDEEYITTIKNNIEPNISLEFTVPNEISSINLGEKVGFVEIIKDGELIKTISIISNEQIKAPTFIDNLKNLIEKF